MDTSNSISGSSCFVGIRCTSSSQVSPDTYGTEKLGTQIINIDALRAIGRIVQAIKQKVEAGGGSRARHDTEKHPAGDPHSPTTVSPYSRQNINREGTKHR
jgi:hypothetical protein